jgi:AsmA protein
MRWIVRIIAALVALALAGTAALFLIPTDRVARLAAAQFERATGRAMTIEGEVSPSFWPELAVKTGPVTIANAAWSSEGPMLRAEGLSIGVDAAALWGGAMRITGVEVTSPVILLERNADGAANWEFETPSGGAATGQIAADAGATSEFSIDRGIIRSGAVTYIDHASGQRLALTDLNAEVSVPDFAGPADVQLSATMNGQPFDTTASVEAFGAALAGQISNLSMTGGAGEANLAFAGRLGFSPVMAEGELEADLGDLSALSTLLAVPKPDLPDGFGATKVAVAGTVTLTAAGTAHLRSGVVALDGNTVSGDVDFVPGDARPKVTAKISAGALNLAGANGNLAGASGGGESGGTSGQPGSGWSKDPIDASGLGLMDVTVALSAQSIDLGAAQLGPTRAVMTIDRARAVFDLAEVSAYGGRVSGQFVVNARDGLSVGGDLDLSGIALQSLLMDLAETDRLIGEGAGEVKFLAVGNSTDAIMRSLSGEGRIALGKGELRGLDLVGMLRTLDPGYVGEGAKTIFDSMKASFTMKDGVLRSDDLAVSAPLLAVSGKGRVNLGKQTMNYRLVPTALGGADGSGGLKVPLDITGPWANLSYDLDLEAMTGVDVDEELKSRLAREAEDRLGVVAGEGESLEDAARRKAQEALEDEAARALERLLGGGN